MTDNKQKHRKELLLENLRHDVYCRIGASKIEGVGIIAIRDIPKGTNPFGITNNKQIKYKSVEITEKELNTAPESVQKIIKDFLVAEKDKNNNNIYHIPFNGPNSFDISFYMNHSKDNNNVNVSSDTVSEYTDFVTNRNIKKGEELTINYEHLTVIN